MVNRLPGFIAVAVMVAFDGANSSAECMYTPLHSFSLDMWQCSQISLTSDTDNSDTLSGLLLTGNVSDHAMDWEGQPETPYRAIWTGPEAATLILRGVRDQRCSDFAEPGVRLVLERICCDTFPHELICSIPFPLARISD